MKFYISGFRSILVIDGWGIPCEIIHRWMPFDRINDKSPLVQVMAWCHQGVSHDPDLCRHFASLGHNELTYKRASYDEVIVYIMLYPCRVATLSPVSVIGEGFMDDLALSLIRAIITLGVFQPCHRKLPSCSDPGVGVTKPIPSVPLFSYFFRIAEMHVTYWI